MNGTQPESPARSGAIVVDCDTCVVRGPACGDCVVTHLLGGPPPEPMHIGPEEQGALEALAGSGLVPPLRLVVPVDGATHSHDQQSPDQQPPDQQPPDHWG